MSVVWGIAAAPAGDRQDREWPISDIASLGSRQSHRWRFSTFPP